MSREPKATVTGASMGVVAKNRQVAVAFKIESKPGLVPIERMAARAASGVRANGRPWL